MEYGIGQIIEIFHNSETIKLKIEADIVTGCTKCFFYSNKHNLCVRHLYKNMHNAYCSSVIRTDKKYIIFKKIK